MTTKTIRFMRLVAHVLLSVAICDILLTPTLACALIGGNYVPLIICVAFLFAACAASTLCSFLTFNLYKNRFAEETPPARPQPWYRRFYRFLTDDGVRFVEFVADPDIRRYCRRCAWRCLAFVLVVAFFVFLLLSRIGLFVLLYPFLIPIVALFGSVMDKCEVPAPCFVRIDGQDYKVETHIVRVSRSVKVLLLGLACLCFPLMVLFAISPDKVEKFESACPIAFFVTMGALALSLVMVLVQVRKWFRYECSTGLSPQPQFRKVFSYPKPVYVDVGPCEESKKSGPWNEDRKITLRCSVSTGRPFRAFAVTYCIIYALFLLSTPFRPLPLDPPPPELMAKIHPCLLDENGNLRKRQIVVVEGIQSYKDIECVITNGTHKEFAVVGAMLSQGFSTQYKEFANEVRDLEQSAKTNLLASVVFENQKGLEDWLGRVTETMNDAKTNAMPQLGYQSIVPDFAVARGEHIRRLLGFLPNIIPFSPGFKALSSLCVDSGNEQKIQDVLGLLSVYLDAMLCGDNNSTYTMYAGIFRRIAVSLIVRFAENADIANDVPPSIETAFCSGGTSLYEKGLWDSYNDFAGCSMTTVDYFLPMSGTSLPKALGELSRRQPRSIGRFFGKEDEVRSRVPIFVNTALWCPILAFLDGYDTSAQMSYLKRGEDWKAILLTKALDADELACDEILNAGTKHPFGRGGLLFGVDHQFGLTMFPNIKPRLLQARYADRYDLVVSAALRLEQFRGEKGRDAASLDEVEEALSWKRNKTDGDIEVVYRPVTPPEGSAEGTFAYVTGLKPKDGCLKAFENTGVAWLVIRNPSFAGTLKRRFMTFEQYITDEYAHPKTLSWDLRVGDEDVKDDPFVLPSVFFGDDPAALEEAVKAMLKRGWAL